MKNLIRVVLAALLIGGVASAQESWPVLSRQTVRVAGVWSGDEQAAFTTVLDEFASLTGANVEFFSTGNDIATVVGTQLEGGSPPDVAMLPQPGLLVEFANRGALVSIEDSVGDLVDVGRLAILPTRVPPIERTLYIIHHEQRYLSPTLKRFLDFCLAAYRLRR